MMLGNVFQQLYTTVDGIIIGQKIGPIGIAATGGTDWLIFMVNGFLIGLIQGFSVILGRKFGEKNEADFDIIRQLITIGLPMALQGLGNTVVPIISSFGQLIMGVFCALAITALIGYRGIFYGEISAWILADMIVIVAYFRDIRKVKAA